MLSKNINRWLIIVSFGAIIVVLSLWTYVDALIENFNYKIVISVFAAALLAAFLYFDERIKDLTALSKINISFTSLTEAFSLISKESNYYKKVRIYAISSYKILSLFSSSNITAEECQVLLRGFSNLQLLDQQDRTFLKEVNEMAAEWEGQMTRGKIRKLELKMYNFLPTEYYVIFDDKYLISGLYTPNKANISKVDVEDPLLINGNTIEGKQIISKYITRFDAFMKDI